MTRKLISFSIVLLLILFSTFKNTNGVPCTFKTSKGVIDMTALSKRPSFTASNTYFQFYVAICNNANHACNGQDYPSSYYLKMNPTSCISSLGQLSQMKISLIDEQNPNLGAVVEYWGGKTAQGVERRTRINVRCDMSTKNTPVDQLQLQYVGDNTEAQYQWFQFELTTAYGCPGSGGGGSQERRRLVGFGGAVIIVIVCLLLLYLIIGSVVMKFKYQKKGWDILIHREFLVQIPLLIWEGLLFIGEGIKTTINKIRGKDSSYSQVD
jgi:hypothetical protein